MSLFELFSQSYGRLYTLLVAARVVFAFVGTGYIHPDEYFQNGEVTAGSVLGLHTLKTWEWDLSFPCRSILPPAMTTGAAFTVLHKLSDNVSPAHIFFAERAVLLLLSFFLDACMYRLIPRKPLLALTLLSSSHVMLTFQLLQSRTRNAFRRNICVLAVLFVDGIFTRITFIAFTAPVAIETLLEISRIIREGGSVRFTSLLRVSAPAVFAAISAYLVYVGVDSVYFLGSTAKPVLTPYNFLLYNLRTENLAEHGIHPRWLHVVVNLPMILGPPLFVAGVRAGWQALRGDRGVKENSSGDSLARMNRVCAWTVLSALLLLSFQPHQEPRFLIPLVFPTILLVANSGIIDRLGKLFWVSTALCNIVLAVIFGFLHQGGIVPSLFRVHELVQQTNHSSAIVYWKTYMPPRHLLAIPETDVQSGLVSIIDLAGADADEVRNALFSLPSSDGTGGVYLVTPPFAVRSLDQRMSQCLKLDKRIYPHLDLDHIPESIEMGWKEGLSLGIYLAELECLKRVADPVS